MKWAMEQAVADLNAKGGVMGRKLRLNFYDAQEPSLISVPRLPKRWCRTTR